MAKGYLRQAAFIVIMVVLTSPLVLFQNTFAQDDQWVIANENKAWPQRAITIEDDGSDKNMQTFPLTQRLQSPIRIFIAPFPEASKHRYERYVTESLDAWSEALDGRLVYLLTSEPSKADIRIYWVDSFRQADQAGNTVFTVGQAAITIRTDNLPDNIIKGNIMHELGHALGIAEHSADDKDIMKSGRSWSSYQEYQSYTPRLSITDKQAIHRLYSAWWKKGDDLYPDTPTPTIAAETPAVLLPNEANPAQGSVKPVNNASYLGTIHQQVQARWESSANGFGQDEVVIALRINKQGELVGYTVQKSSGNPSLDASAIQAIKQAAPFQPPPATYPKPTVNVEVHFF